MMSALVAAARRIVVSVLMLALLASPTVYGRQRAAPLVMTPSVSETFSPDIIRLGGSSLVALTLTNPTTTAATVTAELDDFLPASLVIGGGAGATSCPNGHVSAIAGFSVFALAVGTQIPALGSCTVTVCVTTDAGGDYTNTIPAGALQTDGGNNADPASAILIASADVIFADGFEGQCSS
jgi:hypothetical protein